MDGHRDQWWGGRTYAQHGDDLVLLCMFRALDCGLPRYLDVGAYHPTILSNTALLYARGSRGINVEANPDLFGAFASERPEDINLCVGVGPSPSVRTFYRHDPTCGRNSFDRDRVAEIGITSQIDLTMVTVQHILDNFNGGCWPDLFCLDVEGLELAILRTADFTHSAPKVICVEAIGPDVRRETKGVLNKRFVPWFLAGNNLIFARNDLVGKLT